MPAVVALAGVASEARGPARRDPVHDLALLPTPARRGCATAGAIGSGVQVPLEDLRDLMPRSMAHLLPEAELLSERIQRAPRLLRPRRRHVRVDLRRAQRAVPEQLLDHAQVGARLQQMGRVGVP